jgi:hypothetical protein
MRYFWRAYKTETVLTARTGNDYDYDYDHGYDYGYGMEHGQTTHIGS